MKEEEKVPLQVIESIVMLRKEHHGPDASQQAVIAAFSIGKRFHQRVTDQRQEFLVWQ